MSFVLKHNLKIFLRNLQFWAKSGNKINIVSRYSDTFWTKMEYTYETTDY